MPTRQLPARRAALALVAPLALLAACQDGPLAAAPRGPAGGAAAARGAAEPPDTKQAPGTPGGAGPGGLFNAGRILYVDGGSTHEVHSMNPDGGADKRLTWGTSASSPKWSPDYTKIAFAASEGDGGGGVYVMNADGTGLKQITKTGSFTQSPSWSPDGTRLVFTASVAGASDGEVFFVNADGTQLQRLTYEKSDESEPVFSKDGKRVVFASTRQNATFQHDLWSVALDGSGVVRMTQTPDDELSPAFSPDGTQLAWITRGAAPAVIVAGSFGARPKPVLVGSAYRSVTWSRDAKYLAFQMIGGPASGTVVQKLELWANKPPVTVSAPSTTALAPNWAY